MGEIDLLTGEIKAKMSVRIGQARLRRFAKQITNETLLDEEDRAFLSSALKDITDRGNIEIALDVKAKRVKSKGEYENVTEIDNTNFDAQSTGQVMWVNKIL